MNDTSNFSATNKIKDTNKMPSGIPYIVGNEAAERFSFYGMKSILMTFLTIYMVTNSGITDVLTEAEAATWIHLFVVGVYMFTILGALISDVLWGKYKTIIVFSIIYCLGHLSLAINDTRIGMMLGLLLIALGSGGIKPCVSAHVGDQFGPQQKQLLKKVFSYFYISINVGAALAQTLCPWLLSNETLIENNINSHLAFGIPGALMLLATIVFYFGHNKFTSVPPVSWGYYKSKVFNKSGIKIIKKLLTVFIFLPFFWALFDQTASSIIAQTKSDFIDKELIFGITLLPSQLQALNPILVLILVPLFAFVIYPYFSRKKPLKDLKKVTVGMFLAALSFAILILIQNWIDQEVKVSIAWQCLSYLILTTSEVLISITILEFAYTQAPIESKSLISSINLIMVALGNLITALFNWAIQDESGNAIISKMSYFSFFTILMFVTAFFFSYRAKTYKEETFIQEFTD